MGTQIQNFITLSITTCFIITLTNSCCKENQFEEVDKTFLVPLKVGNFWKYKATHYDSLQNLLYTDTLTIKVIGDTIIDNQIWYNLDYEGVSYRNNSEGLQIYYFNSASLLYRYPIMLGEVYDSSSTSSVTVTSINESVLVPAGKFSCYNYQRKFTDLNINIYLSPGIGFIKYPNLKSINGGRLYVSEYRELISYKIR
jgi:hypothetical protein